MIILCLAIGALVAYAIYQEQKKVRTYTHIHISIHISHAPLSLYHRPIA